MDTNDTILEQKRKKFVEVVYRCCKAEDLALPYINFGDCENEDENQLAHCHPDLYKICISPRQLYKHSFEGIEETASHEVTHLVVVEHGDKFRIKHSNVKLKSFNPHSFPGVVSGNAVLVEKKKLKSIVDKRHCHICGKTINLSKCLYCPHYFDEEHIKPFEPYTDHSSNRPAWMDKDEGHACAYYADAKDKQTKFINEKYSEVLAEITRKGSNYRFNKVDIKELDSYSKQIKETYAPGYKPHFVNQQDFNHDVPHEKIKRSKTLQERILKRLSRKQRKEEQKRIKREELARKKLIEEQNRTEQGRLRERRKEEIEKQKIEEQQKVKQDIEDYKETVQGIVNKLRKPVEEKRSPKYRHTFVNERKNTRLIVAVCCIFLAIILVLFLYNYTKPLRVSITELKDNQSNVSTIVYKTIPIKISFSEYLDNPNKFNNVNITLTGRLKYQLDGTENVGVYNEYTVDDDNKEIRLRNIPQQYHDLFISRQTTKELYNVSGTLRLKYKILEFDVTTIIATERPTQVIQN